MKINIAQSAGFCSGVKRALAIAFDTARNKNKVCMLGDIVHNEDVVSQIRGVGIKKIKRLSKNKDKILLIRAHGISQKILKRAQSLGYFIVDATCPMVKEIHRIAVKAENNGYPVIVIGDKQHDEVRGIIGQLKNKAIVISPKETLPLSRIKKLKKTAIVIQSTQDYEKVQPIVEAIKHHVGNVHFFNTICRPTRVKQQEMKCLPLENDVMLIIGSKTSANTKRLYEIAKSLNKNSYWIQSKNDLQAEWFKNAESVGITAGASTPDKTTNEVIASLKQRFC